MLGRSLAAGLLADDNAKIDTEPIIIAAIADIEGPHLAMLELLVAWKPVGHGAIQFSAENDVMRNHSGQPVMDKRKWMRWKIRECRPNLGPIAPSLLGTLQRHGIVTESNDTDANQDMAFPLPLRPRTSDPVPVWSPTELGEQVFLRFRDAGTDLDNVWSSGPADPQG